MAAQEGGPPPRLGLALSGGGFRASFFHLGALRRLAELRLLKHVTDISTVSGGSIVAAHYYLHFKRRFEQRGGRLSDDDYLAIVHGVEREFIKGNRADLRNRLLFDPFTHLRAFLLGRGYGSRMAQLYTKYFYRSVTEDMYGRSQLSGDKRWIKDGIPLHEAIVMRPDRQATGRYRNKSSSYPNTVEPESLLAEFNLQPEFASIPRVVINATCLNTGGPFHFLLNEVGGSETGYIRYDEAFMLLQYKLLITSFRGGAFSQAFLIKAMNQALKDGANLERTYPQMPATAFKRSKPTDSAEDAFPAHTAEHLFIYLSAKRRMVSGDPLPNEPWVSGTYQFPPSSPVTEWLLGPPGWFPLRHLMECDFGLLRRAKIAAWFLLDEVGWARTALRGGRTWHEYHNDFWRALRAIDEPVAVEFEAKPESLARVAAFVIDLYYLRTAEVIDWETPKALRKLTLSHAVAASANFPPVFTPFKIFNLFDGERFESLALTDGGIHDNQGVEALQDAGCSYIIVSDAGGLVRPEYRTADARIPMMDRVIDLLMGGVRRALLRSLQRTVDVATLAHMPEAESGLDNPERRRIRESTTLRKVAIFHMTSNPSEGSQSGLAGFAPTEVAQIRTDLDAFNALEIAALRHQGYQLADRFVSWFAKNEPFGDPAVPPLRPLQSPSPELPAQPTPRHRRLLAGSARLVGRFSVAYPMLAAILAIVAAVGVWKFPYGPTFQDLHKLYSFSFAEKLGDGQVTPKAALIETIKTNGIWQAIGELRILAVERTKNRNALFLPFALWAALLILQESVRVYRNRVKSSLIVVTSEVWKDRLRWAFALIKRPWNLLTIASAITFALTLEVKWLIGFVPLWAFAAAIAFAFMHHVFMRFWRLAGALPPPPPPPIAEQRVEPMAA